MGYANDDGGVDDEPALPTVETSREMTAKKFCDLNWNTWILRRHLLSQFKKFVHNQKGCHRVYGWKCDDCILEKRKNGKTRKEGKEFHGKGTVKFVMKKLDGKISKNVHSKRHIWSA
ncbi:hypothetical protein B9Z55_004406 [Caenorhabditis nigoni]|uniref:Uncharacterized protein n=1 Tax=Caenorhabditis nigoni TaxID=1611254 RepID=A0A2G5UX46_9PELO|nr:hypothetical protein B9Z55_004406 [Caenorhabditis nigoni]